MPASRRFHQPHLSIAAAGAPGHVQAGVEYLYWRNKFGVEGVTERVLQPALGWTF